MRDGWHADIRGEVSQGFEPVREAFAENFQLRNELGAACCIYRNGEKVVDLWGGVRDKATGAPWQPDTMVLVYSATKGLAAMVIALAHSRGWLDYDARVAEYWPEFAQAGKEAITVRQLLGHQAGLHAFHAKVDRETLADPDRLAAIMSRERPEWEPGTRLAYHALTLGFYEGEIIRRVDPEHRTLGLVFRDDIARPLGADAHIRLPEKLPDERLAPLEQAGMLRALLAFPTRLAVAAINPRSHLYRALAVNPGSSVVLDEGRIYVRELEVPSGGGVCSARGLARLYGVYAAGGAELGLRPETLAALRAPPVPPARGSYDACMKGEIAYALGFMKPSGGFPFGHPGAFGAPGAGGAMGYADPGVGIGYGYVTNRMGVEITGDPRDVALREALASVTG